MIIVGWNNWFCSVNYPAIPKPYFTDGHPDEIDFKEAEDFGGEMVSRSLRIYKGEIQLIPKFPTGREYDEIYDPLPPPPKEATEEFYLNHFGLKFSVDKDKCKYPKCTLCIDNCPMQSINFSVSPPSFDVNCDKCFLCEQICPNGAINYDWDSYVKSHLAMIPPLEESLKLFEERGKFRRLISQEKIGWDTFFWKKRHPRFKVK
jgi:ferredoxin